MYFVAVAAAVVSLAAPADIQKSIDAFVAKAPGVVVAVGVVDHGKTTEYFAGKPPSGAPKLDANAEFQIGSITKTFTATLLAEMALDGEVKLDDPISKYLPSNVKAPSYGVRQITLLNLAEQNSGLPRLPSNLDQAETPQPYSDYDTAKLYAFLDGYKLTRAPGAKFEYSNLGVGLLGTLLANAVHMTYPQLVEERVLKPLAMNETSAVLPRALKTRMMPGFAPDLSQAPPWIWKSLSGAGSINSSLHDMLRYLQANIDAPAGKLGKAMAFAHKQRTAATSPETIGLNWLAGPSGVILHDGATGGYSSFLAFDPASKTGVVVLTNVWASNGQTDVLAAHILESARYPKIAAIEPPAKPVGNSPFVGVYELSPAFRITVFESGGTLYGQATGQQPYALTLQSGTTYAVQGVAARVTFMRDAKGRVSALVLHQNGVDQTAKRMTP